MPSDQGTRLLGLLTARGSKTDKAEAVRARERAKLTAEDFYFKLLIVLAEDRWLFEERHPLIEHLKGEELSNSEMMVVEELGCLLGISVQEAVLVKEERAGYKRWYAAYVSLPTLRELLHKVAHNRT